MLSETEKSDALEEVGYCVLCQGVTDGIEYGDSIAKFHKLRATSEQKDKTIVVRKQMLESAQRLNEILRKTGIKWVGSGVTAKGIQSLQDELDRRGIAMTSN